MAKYVEATFLHSLGVAIVKYYLKNWMRFKVERGNIIIRDEALKMTKMLVTDKEAQKSNEESGNWTRERILDI